MRNIPTITKNLLIINLLAFIAMYVVKGAVGIDLNNLLGLHFFMASDFQVYQLVTYMFMHASIEHIAFNMFALWMFGCVVENVWGPKKFLFYYIFCGVGAGMLQEVAQFFSVYMTFNAQQPMGILESFGYMAQYSQMLNGLTTVGASGAIYSILLAFGMLFPENRIFVFPLPIPIKAKYFVMGYAAIELFSALATPGDHVAHLAHLGGMIFGFFLIRYWRNHPQGGGGYNVGGGSDVFERMRSYWEKHSHNKTSSNSGFNSNGYSGNTTSTGNPDWDYNARQKAKQAEVDRILDKVRKSGYESLTKEEKNTLFEQKRK